MKNAIRSQTSTAASIHTMSRRGLRVRFVLGGEGGAGSRAGSRTSSVRSALSSASALTPYSLLRASRFSAEGRAEPVSHLDTVCRETDSSSASSIWDSP